MPRFIEYAVSGNKIVAMYRVGEKKGKNVYLHKMVAEFTSNAHAKATLNSYFDSIESVKK